MPNAMLHEETAVHWPAPFALASLTIVLLTVLAEVGNVIAGLTGTPRGTVGALLWAATLPAVLGVALGIISLMRREEGRLLSHLALWANGAIVIFATPLSLAWTLGMK